MRLSFPLRVAALAFMAALFAAAASPSKADNGSVRIEFVKAGWFVGGSLGEGTLNFQGRTYRLGIGGLSAGLTFGASKTTLTGTARNMNSAHDITGTYVAVGAGAAIAGGVREIELKNGKGVFLRLRGASAGLSFDLDLSGMEITIK